MTRGIYLQMFMLRFIHVLLVLSTVTASRPYATLSDLGFSTALSFFTYYKDFSKRCTAVTPGVDYRRDKESIVLANFNAHFLFAFNTPHDSPYRNPKLTFEHVVKVAEVISKTDADIIHLTEVEDCRVLQMLCDILEIRSKMKYMPLLAQGRDSTTRQNVGILTRISPSVEEFKALIKSNEEGVSLTKAYVTRFNVAIKDQTINLVLAGAHLLRGAFENDKITPQSIAKRESQALILADEINHFKETSDYLVLMGDFNDMDPEAPFDDNSMAESETVSILRSKLSSSDYSMKNITTLFEGRNRASCTYGRFNKLGLTQKLDFSLDHILYDDRLRALNFEILNNLYDGAYVGGPNGHHYSDHYAVVAKFTFLDQLPSLIGDSISQKGPRLNFAASLGAANIQEPKEVNMTPKFSFADALKEAEKKEEAVSTPPITNVTVSAPKKVEWGRTLNSLKTELGKKENTLPVVNVPVIAPKKVEWGRTLNSLKTEIEKKDEAVSTPPITNVTVSAPKQVEWGRTSNPLKTKSFFYNKYSGYSGRSKWDNEGKAN